MSAYTITIRQRGTPALRITGLYTSDWAAHDAALDMMIITGREAAGCISVRRAA